MIKELIFKQLTYVMTVGMLDVVVQKFILFKNLAGLRCYGFLGLVGLMQVAWPQYLRFARPCLTH